MLSRDILTQMDCQEAEDVSECQTAGVAHEELVPFHGVPEDVIEPEYEDNAEGGHGKKRV